MKKSFLILFTIIISFNLFAQPPNFDLLKLMADNNSFFSKIVGKEFVDFNLGEKVGQTLSKTDLAGCVVYINLWFIACPPCVNESKSIDDLYKKYANNDRVKIVTITFDDKKEVDSFMRKNGYSFPVYFTSKENCYKLLYDKGGFPGHYVLDKKGIIRDCRNGGFGFKEDEHLYYEKKWPNLIDKLLDE